MSISAFSRVSASLNKCAVIRVTFVRFQTNVSLHKLSNSFVSLPFSFVLFFAFNNTKEKEKKQLQRNKQSLICIIVLF